MITWVIIEQDLRNGKLYCNKGFENYDKLRSFIINNYEDIKFIDDYTILADEFYLIIKAVEKVQ